MECVREMKKSRRLKKTGKLRGEGGEKGWDLEEWWGALDISRLTQRQQERGDIRHFSLSLTACFAVTRDAETWGDTT